jgi:hypothetical protein
LAPPAGERINALEAASERLQEGLDELRQEQATHCVATRKKFATLEKSISNLGAKTQANIDTLGAKMQASIDALAMMVQTVQTQQASQARDTAAILAILMSVRQETQVPVAMTLLLHMPKDPASVALPASPSPANSPVVAPDDVPLPIGDPPESGGLLFTTLSAPRNKVKGETEEAYRPCVHKDAKAFLGGRLPGSDAKVRFGAVIPLL